MEKSIQGVKSTRELHDYWVSGPGLAKWVDTPHPDEAKRTAAQWFHDRLGFWPGDERGRNPVGPG